MNKKSFLKVVSLVLAVVMVVAMFSACGKKDAKTSNVSSGDWEGVLYDVGNDYVTIYQPGRDRYIVNDIYSLKYTEFYDVRRRQLCDRLMQEQGWDVGEAWPPSR